MRRSSGKETIPAAYEEEIHPYGIIRLPENAETFELIFKLSEKEIAETAPPVYRPAVQKYKDELFETVKRGLKPLTF